MQKTCCKLSKHSPNKVSKFLTTLKQPDWQKIHSYLNRTAYLFGEVSSLSRILNALWWLRATSETPETSSSAGFWTLLDFTSSLKLGTLSGADMPDVNVRCLGLGLSERFSRAQAMSSVLNPTPSPLLVDTISTSGEKWACRGSRLSAEALALSTTWLGFLRRSQSYMKQHTQAKVIRPICYITQLTQSRPTEHPTPQDCLRSYRKL